MAAPNFGSAGAGAASTTATLNVPYPSGISAGDLLVLHIMHQSAWATVTDPSGWTVIRKRDQADGENNGIYAYWKIATGSESGSLAVTNDSGEEGWFGRMYRFTGNDTSSPIEGSSTTTTVATPTGEDSNVTTTGVDRLVVQLVAKDSVDTLGAFTGQTGGTWAEAAAEYTDNSGIGLGDGRTGVTLQLQTATIAASGTIGGGEYTGSATADTIVYGFAIVPSTGGGGGSQVLSPSADSVDGAWTDQGSGTSLAAALDASESTYIQSEESPSNSGCRVKLSAGSDPGISTGHVLHWSIEKAGSGTINMTLKLMQGGGNVLGAGTEIASFARDNVSVGFSTFDENLSGSQADSITNYGDLYLEFYADEA